MDKAAAAGNNEFQSTRPVWGATEAKDTLVAAINISIHAPRVGRDDEWRYLCMSRPVFQSTRPVWGATVQKS